MVRRTSARRTKRKKKFQLDRKWMLGIGGAAAVAIVCTALFLILGSQTTEAKKGELSFSESGQGIIIRSETLYKSENYGKVEFLAEEGQAVTEGTPIAAVYSWNYSDKDYADLKALQDKIMDYQQGNILKDVVNKDLENLNKVIEEKSEEIRAVTRGEAEGDLLQMERELETLMEERTKFLKESVKEDQTLADFYQQEAALVAKIDDWKEITLAKGDGVVSFYFDGTETLLQPSNMKKLTLKNINDILEGKTFYKADTATASRPFYRLVNPNEWYVVMVCDREIPEFVNGMAFTVDFSYGGDGASYTGNLSDHRTDGGKHLYYFSFTQPIDKLLLARQVEMTVSADYVGIQVPAGAVKEVEGQKGVYYKDGENKAFAPVTVLIEKDGQAIVQPIDLKSPLDVGSLIYP